LLRQGQRDAHAGALRVAQVDLGDRRRLFDELVPALGELLSQVDEHALNVLAGADGVGAVVGARAAVELLGERADADGVGAPGGGGHLEGAVDGVLPPVDNLRQLLFAALAATLDLLLEQCLKSFVVVFHSPSCD